MNRRSKRKTSGKYSYCSVAITNTRGERKQPWCVPLVRLKEIVSFINADATELLCRTLIQLEKNYQSQKTTVLCGGINAQRDQVFFLQPKKVLLYQDVLSSHKLCLERYVHNAKPLTNPFWSGSERKGKYL